MAQINGNGGFTLTVLGCGTMGIAILSGIFSALDSLQVNLSQPKSRSGTSTPASSVDLPLRLPSRFVACVRRSQSVQRIKSSLSSSMTSLEVLENENLRGVQGADVVLLGCKPQMVAGILSAPGIRDALKGKLLISILAGVSVSQIEEILYGSSSDEDPEKLGRCRIIRAMPNTASFVRESMTVIANSIPPLPQEQAQLVTWMFERIGRVVHLPAASMDASTALCGSGPAFMALVLEAIADGGVAMGLPRAEAQIMAAQTMRGTTGLVLNGEHPAVLKDKVTTPGGCTIGGLLVLEEGRVRGTMSRAIREATVVASQLGKGVEGVNGTRW
ncbi:pyrroline-5-carboxylate reductase [Viridothelium virens]|uniref:Pyrroline-5-carboxylate reductase n=1 Tax=Viridothelium virens TaxID=1048519 RepID=A0A6A6H6K4_VIRVR|nr:pyrroline-5-carboxylate reductase [Viridothelium virens]